MLSNTLKMSFLAHTPLPPRPLHNLAPPLIITTILSCFSLQAAIELNNGRAAQMGILTLMVHERLNNDPYIINSLLGSPVAFN